MKSKIVVSALFIFTVVTVVIYPMVNSKATTTPTTKLGYPPETISASKIEVVFVLDTTGSMGGLIQAAKEKIWSIANTMASAQSAPEIKMGLVAYRDRGDQYVTQVVDLSEDLDSVYATLMDFRARGGGDGPESVNQALYDAVHKISWSADQTTYKVVFLIGDAPPHMDYQDDVKYPVTINTALKKGIVINSIQSGKSKRTAQRWQQIAQLGNGEFFRVEQNGSAVAIATPFDRELAKLSKKMDATRLYYGDKTEKEKQKRKLAATEKLHAKASMESRARRATFNSSKSGKSNLLGNGELVDDVSNGKVDLSKIDKDHLPEAMKAMSPTEQKATINSAAKERSALQSQIQVLADKRSDYLKRQFEKLGGEKDSLDEKMYRAVKKQAGKKGLRYESEAAAY
ncbi:VWA domain-containing protein [Pseudomonadota bacterium]